MNEFEIIKKYFNQNKIQRPEVVHGIGDDGAVFKVPNNHTCVSTMDNLIAGVHFPKHTAPENIGYRSLAINLSDLAAMGATPFAALLSLTLPQVNRDWLKKFSQGFFKCAKTFEIALIGGNIAKGPLNIAVTAFGFLPAHKTLLRSCAKAGDVIAVTDTLGDAKLVLKALTGKVKMPGHVLKSLEKKYFQPMPHVAAGKILLNYASSCIDISDGFLQDLSHIVTASKVGAVINSDKLPLSGAMKKLVKPKRALEYALNGSDDYVLLFTINAKKLSALQQHLKVYEVGKIVKGSGIKVVDAQDRELKIKVQGYQHF